MLAVFADAGLPVQRHFADGEVALIFPLPADEAADVGSAGAVAYGNFDEVG